jgi:hypothetical protein
MHQPRILQQPFAVDLALGSAILVLALPFVVSAALVLSRIFRPLFLGLAILLLGGFLFLVGYLFNWLVVSCTRIRVGIGPGFGRPVPVVISSSVIVAP